MARNDVTAINDVTAENVENGAARRSTRLKN